MTSKKRVLKDTAPRSGSRCVLKGRASRPRNETDLKAAVASPDTAGNMFPVAATTDAVRQCLTDHIGALRFVNGTLAVCAQALRQQNAEIDADIALVIQRTAGDKLDATIDQIEELMLGLELQEVA